MGIQIVDPQVTTQIMRVDATHGAGRVSVRPLEAIGHYRLAATSGLITTVAAATATAGHLFAWRWGDSSRLAVLAYVRAKWNTIAGFTAAQEVGMDLVIARSYSASHSGGTALTLTGSNLKKRTSSSGSTLLTAASIATTGALTAGTHTLDTQAMLSEQYAELAAAATVIKGRMIMDWDMSSALDHPMVFAQNEGFVIRNSILMGAGGTARLNVEVAWAEVNTY
jgi:hypothetical protein